MRLIEESSWGRDLGGLLAFLEDHVRTEELAIGEDVHRASYPDAARCYLADRRGVAWTALSPNGSRLAVDAELIDQRIPPAVLQRAHLSLDDVDAREVWRRWTQAEVVAKLRDIPILMWLREYRLTMPLDVDADGPIALRTVDHDGLIVTFGILSEET